MNEPAAEAEQRAYLARVLERARTATETAGLRRHDLDLAGSVIRLCFAGPVLEGHFMPAFRHLEHAEAGQPDVTFHVFDTDSTGVKMLPPPWPRWAFTDRGEIPSFSSDRIRTAFHYSEYALCMLDLDAREGVYWMRSADALPYWAKASPLRTLFHWWTEEQGAQLIHGAVVGTPDGAVLITGKGGVGKSTTALSCLTAGFRYTADDFAVITLDPQPMAHCLYATAKVNADRMALYTEYEPRILEGPTIADAKAVMFFGADRIAQNQPLRAVATPRFGQGADSRVEPIPLAEIREAAATATIAQLPHAGQATIAFVSRLLDRLPGHALVLGTDTEKVPDAIAQLCAIRMPGSVSRAGRSSEPVSVIIPTYNGAAFLADAVRSILDQHHEPIEIIVVDDGSTDAIEEAVARLPVPVKFIRQANAGPSAARNRGVAEATSDFVAFLDVDDLWPRDKIAIALERFRAEPALDVVSGYGQLMRFENGENIAYGDPAGGYPFYIGAGVYRRSAFERVGGFDERLRFAEDTDWAWRARDAGLNIAQLGFTTLLVRRHGANMTSGRKGGELLPLRLLKNMIDRKRASEPPVERP